MRDKHPYAFFTLTLIFFAAISYIGLALERTQSTDLVMAYFAAFFSYFWMSRFESDRFFELFALGMIVRFSLFFSLPNLSDDFYRFIWDGFLVKAGLNPYTILPGEIEVESIPGLTEEIFQGLNSKSYYTIYPPFNQWVFWLSSIMGNNILHSVNLIRVILLTGDIMGFFLLRTLLHNKKHAWWFFLNPLVILEFTGNLHFEGLMIFFILLTLYSLNNHKLIQGALSLGAAIATKLIPLIFIPYLAWRFRWRNGAILTIVSFLLVFFTFLPFLYNQNPDGLISSFVLYFKKFEFNASVYFLLREIGYQAVGFNIIGELGPRLAILSAFLILMIALAFSHFKRPISETLLFTLSCYLFFSTTVHPWYILPLIPLGVLSGYYFPVVWSFLIFLTYIGYSKDPYHLPILFVIVEYVIVFSVLIYEIWKKQKNFFYTTNRCSFYGF